MHTPGSPAVAHDRLNAVCQYAVYGPDEMPSVEVCAAPAPDGVDATWAAGELRMATVHEDGSRMFTVQFHLGGRLLVDNFTQDRVRRPHSPPTPHVEPTKSVRRRFSLGLRERLVARVGAQRM